MSLLRRPTVRIGRAQRVMRDDRIFVVATEDTHGPSSYFQNLPFPRVRVVVLETLADSGQGSPMHVVERCKVHREAAQQRRELQPYDEFWIPIDTDHRFEGRHLSGSNGAIRQAQQARIRVAVSNPCFELWLLLHHEPVASGATFEGCGGVEERLRSLLGSFNKASINPAHFPLAKVHDAIRNARNLEDASESAEHRWPRSVGTQIHRLLESILNPPG